MQKKQRNKTGLSKAAKCLAMCLMVLGMIALWGCSDDSPKNEDENVIPEDPIDYFSKDSVFIGNGPALGNFWYVNKIRIQDSKGNNLLSKKIRTMCGMTISM